MRKFLRAGLLLLSAALVLLVLLMARPQFNSWLVRQFVEQIPELSIARVDGLLLGQLQVTDIHYQTEQVNVSIKSLTYQYSVLDLLAARIRLKSVQANVVDVVLYDIDTQDSESDSLGFVMPVTVQLDDLSVRDISIKQKGTDYLIEKVGAALSYQGQQLQVNKFSLQSDIIQLQGTAALQLEAQLPFTMDLKLAKSLPDFDVKAQVALQGDTQKISLDARILTPSEMHVKGRVTLNGASPRFDLQLAWDVLQWPLQGSKQYASENARLTLQGMADDYLLTFNADLFAKDLVLGKLHLLGQGDTEQLTLNTLTLEALKGDIQGKGRISWTDSISTDLRIQVHKILLGSLLPAYPGEISLDARLSGQLFNKPDLYVQVEKLHGKVWDKKLQAEAKIHYSPKQTTIEQFQARMGANFVNLQGKLGEHNELTFKLDARDLHELSSDMTGLVLVEGVVQGKIQQPVIKFKLQATGFKFAEQQIGSIRANAAIDTSEKGQLDLQLIARHIVLHGKKVERIELQSLGSNAHHELRAQIMSEQANLDFTMHGVWEPLAKEWQGQVRHLSVQGGSAGSWRLIKTSPLLIRYADQQAVQLDTELCLAQKNGTGLLCVRAQSESAGQKLTGSIKQLPMSVFADWMPTAITVNSYLHSEFSLSLQEILRGEMQLTLDPGVIIVEDEVLGVQRRDFKVAHFSGKLLADSLQSDLAIVLNDANHIEGQLRIDGLKNTATASVKGLLTMQLDNIGFISAFSDSVSHVAGDIKAELYLQGLLQSPNLNNSWLRLQQGELTVVDAGVQINEINIELKHSAAEQILLQGRADIAGQPLLLSGHIKNYAGEQLKYKLAMQGEDLPLLELPEMQAWLSPELQLTGDKYGAKISGDITVPKAILVFQTLPESAVELSGDEVIVSDKKPEPKVSKYLVDMDVLIKLGKAVSIEGFGLKARLEGQLRALRKKNNLKLFNELNFRQGTYTAYGQDLTLKKGQLLFAGNMENPGIIILASRKASDWDDKTIAYLSMTGTLKKPVTRIYTEPALSDSEALAYLLTGAPLGKGDASSSALIAKAALSLGREYVDAVMGTVGIDEFDIKSTALGQNSMVVGKRITPRLYARYIMDILTTQMQFAVEYKLTNNISIETRAGSTHSSDIKYNIQFD